MMAMFISKQDHWSRGLASLPK